MGTQRLNCGFTLIELLVVLAILATLLTIAVPRYFNSIDQSKEAALKQNLLVMRDAIDKFHSDHGQYPNSLQSLAKGRYIRFVPEDPLTKSKDTWVLIKPADEDSDANSIYDVRSGAPGKSRDGTSYATW
ncbi:type II secretion system GspH family protein [Limnobacter humi]|uniref:Type II secretion system GspH family protein n=1 Tax=Limnobacter humi TaxID=1778671 RepID=A0ABT1WFV0_9BURK|nr:prepilin-type N-terminal cleavage/methylation domain-containing protein [Limnobacter humi]MCQ8895627.1 type II secretion system GspH family protein [Limnobacter humi]